MTHPSPRTGQPADRVRCPADAAVVMTELILPQHTNALGTAFGGQILSWVDIAAAIVAQRHSGRICVTLSFDEVRFRAPIRLGDVVCVEARPTYVGRTSMEVIVDVYREPVGGTERELALEAFTTFVSVDDDGQPIPLPPMQPITDEEKRAWREAEARRAERLARAGRG